MTDLLEFPTPPASAYGVQPLSVAEVDAHPDSTRIWATIMALRDTAEQLEKSAYDQGYDMGFDAGIHQ